MALEGSILVKGAAQGGFKGGNPMKSRAGTSVVTAFEMAVVAPRDNQTGVSSGKRQWQALRHQQPADAATINYQQALVTNEVLTSVMYNFFRPESNQLTTAAQGKVGGEQKPYYTIELTNAQVQSVRMIQFDTRSDNQSDRNREIIIEVLLTFMKITQTWTDGGITMTDDWTVGV